MYSVTDVTKDELMILDKYRKAKEMMHSALEITLQAHIQDGVLIHVNVTEKFRPQQVGKTTLRENANHEPGRTDNA